MDEYNDNVYDRGAYLSRRPAAVKDRSMDMLGEKKRVCRLISLLDRKKKLYRQHQEDWKHKPLRSVACV